MSEELVKEDDAPVVPNASPAYYRIFVASILNDGWLVYTDQVSENGPFSGNATVLSDRKFTGQGLSASTTIDGYVSLVAQAQGSHELIYFAERKLGEEGKRFAEEIDLGKPAGMSSASTALLCMGLNGLANVFALDSGSAGAVWWKYHNPPGTETRTETVTPPGTDTPIEVTVEVRVPPTKPWSDWVDLAGGLKQVTATNNADGRLILAGLNASGGPFLNMQTSDNPSTAEHWTGWRSLVDGSVVSFDQLEMAMDANALVHIFARHGSRIYMKVQTEVSSESFTDWVLFAVFDHPIQTIAVANNDDGGLYVAAHVGEGMESPIYSTHQIDNSTRHWTAPRIATFMREPGPVDIELFPNADTELSMFVLNTRSHDLNYTRQSADGFWLSGWKPVGEKLASFSVTQDVTPNPSLRLVGNS